MSKTRLGAVFKYLIAFKIPQKKIFISANDSEYQPMICNIENKQFVWKKIFPGGRICIPVTDLVHLYIGSVNYNAEIDFLSSLIDVNN